MYTWPTKTSKTTIHGMDPGWKANPTPYQSPDPSPTYTETARSPVYYESGSEPESERSNQGTTTGLTYTEEFGSPTYSEPAPEPTRAEAWSSPTYAEPTRCVWWSSPTKDTPWPGKSWEELEAIQARNLGWEKSPIYEWEDYTSSQVSSPPVKEEPKFRIKMNGRPSRFDVRSDQLDQWKAMSLLCAQKLEETKEEARKMETAEKRKESSRPNDRFSPYNRRLDHRSRRRSSSRNGRHRHEEHRKDRANRRRRHEDRDCSSRRPDRRQSPHRHPDSSRSSKNFRRDERRHYRNN